MLLNSATEACKQRPALYCADCLRARAACACGQPTTSADAVRAAPPAGLASAWAWFEEQAEQRLGWAFRSWAPPGRARPYAAGAAALLVLAGVRLAFVGTLWRLLSYGDLRYSGTLGGSRVFVAMPLLTPMLVTTLSLLRAPAVQRALFGRATAAGHEPRHEPAQAPR